MIKCCNNCDNRNRDALRTGNIECNLFRQLLRDNKEPIFICRKDDDVKFVCDFHNKSLRSYFMNLRKVDE